MSAVEPLDSSLRDEVVELTRALIRVDTSNPPGGETAAAELLAEHLGRSGVECELAGPDPERLNLIARIEGRGEGPSLMLLGHTDVVPAPAENWTVDPFAGELRDDHVVGRGAADMKNELAARAVALAAYARGGETPAGDIVLVAESDEERNVSDCGISWLVRERPGLRCDYALNEGGGLLLPLSDGRRLALISVGEKQVTSARLRVFGSAGHASVPAGADNPIAHLARAVSGLAESEAPGGAGPVLARALDVLGLPGELSGAAAARAAALHPSLGELLPAMTRMTVTPTGVASYEPANVIPPYADVICDCRALPGQTEDDIRAHVAAAIGDGVRYEFELLEPLEGGTESPIETPLYRACEEWLARRVPGAELLPVISPGFSDSSWVRGAFGTTAYGFAPVFTTDPAVYEGGFHGADERIHVADLAEIAEFTLHAIRALNLNGV